MSINEINEHYIVLCKRMNIRLNVQVTDDKSALIQDIRTENGEHTIILNIAQISEEDYDSYLGYNVSKILLSDLFLETDRLILRRFKPDDAADCFEFMSDSEGCYLDCCKPFSKMNEEYERQMALFAEREWQYVIALRNGGKVIGTIHVFDDDSRAVEAKEIGYSISPSYRRQGFAFEILTALIELLQSGLHIELVVAGVLAENTASIALLKKLGFHEEGIRHKCVWHEGLNKPVDLSYYYIDRTAPQSAI